MDILLFDDNFLLTQPFWSQFLLEPEIKNFTLLSDFWKWTWPKLKNIIFAIVLQPYNQI